MATTDSKKEIKTFYERFHREQRFPVSQLQARVRHNFLKKLIQPMDGKFLVIGCGSKDEMAIFQNKKQVTGIDISKTAVESQKKRFPEMQFLVADAQDLPFDDKSFDCIVCSEVIEHLPNDEKFLNGVQRILKKSGILIITAPNWYSWYGLARRLGEFILRKPLTSANQPIDRWYTPKEIEERVKSRFNILGVWGLWYFPPTGRGRYRIPDYLVLPFLALFYPLEWILRYTLPKFGHIMVLKLEKK